MFEMKCLITLLGIPQGLYNVSLQRFSHVAGISAASSSFKRNVLVIADNPIATFDFKGLAALQVSQLPRVLLTKRFGCSW